MQVNYRTIMEVTKKLSFHSKGKINKTDASLFSIYNYLFDKWNNWRKKRSMCALYMIFVINVNINVNMSIKDEWPVTVIINTVEGEDSICCGCYISCCSQFVDCIVETCISPKSRLLPFLETFYWVLGTVQRTAERSCVWSCG